MLDCIEWPDGSAIELTRWPATAFRPSRQCLVGALAASIFPPWRPFFDGHIVVMVYSYRYHLDSMTPARPLGHLSS